MISPFAPPLSPHTCARVVTGCSTRKRSWPRASSTPTTTARATNSCARWRGSFSIPSSSRLAPLVPPSPPISGPHLTAPFMPLFRHLSSSRKRCRSTRFGPPKSPSPPPTHPRWPWAPWARSPRSGGSSPRASRPAACWRCTTAACRTPWRLICTTSTTSRC